MCDSPTFSPIVSFTSLVVLSSVYLVFQQIWLLFPLYIFFTSGIPHSPDFFPCTFQFHLLGCLPACLFSFLPFFFLSFLLIFLPSFLLNLCIRFELAHSSRGWKVLRTLQWHLLRVFLLHHNEVKGFPWQDRASVFSRAPTTKHWNALGLSSHTTYSVITIFVIFSALIYMLTTSNLLSNIFICLLDIST